VIQSATPTIRCFSSVSLPLTARFDRPQLTSDGGLVWLAEVDAALGLSARLADAIPEWRTGPVRHPLLLLLRQRIFQIACGYEDQDDADTLRYDPLFKLACGRLSEESALACQPPLSRFENAIDARTCRRLADALLPLYLEERGRDGRPERILIDADSTDDPTYGDQEGSAYHGYYQQHFRGLRGARGPAEHIIPSCSSMATPITRSRPFCVPVPGLDPVWWLFRSFDDDELRHPLIHHGVRLRAHDLSSRKDVSYASQSHPRSYPTASPLSHRNRHRHHGNRMHQGVRGAVSALYSTIHPCPQPLSPPPA